MSDERNVMCPWCGWDMVAREAQDIFHGKYNVYVCEACEAVSPIAYSDKAAYLAATAAPPNRPMTFDGMAALDESDAVWVVSKDGAVCVVNGLDAYEYAGYEYDALYFARKPTPADIAAAKAAKEKEH